MPRDTHTKQDASRTNDVQVQASLMRDSRVETCGERNRADHSGGFVAGEFQISAKTTFSLLFQEVLLAGVFETEGPFFFLALLGLLFEHSFLEAVRISENQGH